MGCASSYAAAGPRQGKKKKGVTRAAAPNLLGKQEHDQNGKGVVRHSSHPVGLESLQRTPSVLPSKAEHNQQGKGLSNFAILLQVLTVS
jgi:hypothetical protein